MNIPTNLIAKGLAGAAAVAASVGVATNWDKISGLFGSAETALSEAEIIAKVGLSCGANRECALKEGEKIKIKQEGNKSGEINNLPTSTGKIKLYKNESAYANGLKFVVEGSDITVTGGSVAKLEEFDTYEIIEETENDGKKYYLSRKTKAVDEKSKILGLTSLGDNCKLPENNTEVICADLDATKLKAINFERKTSEEATVDNARKPKLKISKSSDTSTFTDGYKFVFESAGDASIPATSSAISLKANTNTEFKIKKTNNNLTLEKAWDITKLAGKVSMTDCTTDLNASTKECTLGNTINVIESQSNKATGLTVTTGTKISFTANEANYNQGFKFTVTAESDIPLTGTSSGINTLAKDSTYEIKEDGGSWYLSKKSPN